MEKKTGAATRLLLRAACSENNPANKHGRNKKANPPIPLNKKKRGRRRREGKSDVNYNSKEARAKRKRTRTKTVKSFGTYKTFLEGHPEMAFTEEELETACMIDPHTLLPMKNGTIEGTDQEVSETFTKLAGYHEELKVASRTRQDGDDNNNDDDDNDDNDNISDSPKMAFENRRKRTHMSFQAPRGMGKSEVGKGHDEMISEIVRDMDKNRMSQKNIEGVKQVSPVVEWESKFISAPGKTSREIFDNDVARGIEDAVDEDIAYVAQLQAHKKKPPDLLSQVINSDNALDNVDHFYTDQIGGPSFRDIVTRIMEVKARAEEGDKAYHRHSSQKKNKVAVGADGEEEGTPVIGPKELVIKMLIDYDDTCEKDYRWRADVAIGKKMTHRPLGTPVSMEYANEFLRQPVDDERECVRGPHFCISAVLPQMQGYPNTLDTHRVESGFVGREFFTPNEFRHYQNAKKWPRIRGMCFLCLVFLQTYKCLCSVKNGVGCPVPYQIQKFQMQVEEGVGYSKNQMLPTKLEDGTRTGIIGDALEFRISDYIPDTTTVTRGMDTTKVKCYSQRVYHF
jgi:hypothetical protein